MPAGFKIADAFVEVTADAGPAGKQIQADVGKASDKAGSEGGKKLGGKLLGAFAALGIGAAIGKSLMAGMDVQAGQSKLSAQLGLTKTEAGVVGKAAGKLFSGGYGTGIDQINEAIASVVQNVGGMRDASSQDLEKIGGKALNVANIFDQDLGGVTRAVGGLMKTGLAKNADEAMDIVVAGFQRGANKSDDFLDTLNEYGVQFAKMGIDGAQATGIIQQGLQAGARDGDLVADSIKEFSIRAVDGSKTTAEGFKMLGLDGAKMGAAIAKGGDSANGALSTTMDRLRGIKDPVIQAQAASALFGSQAEDMGAALLAIDPSTAVAGLGEVAGAADTAGASFNDNAKANMGTFFRQLQGGATAVIGGVLIPALTSLSGMLSGSVGPAFSMAGGVIKSTTGWLQEHSGLVKGVMVVLGPAVGAYVLWTGAIKAWALVTRGAIAVQLGFNAVMAANPIMLVVIGLGLLVGGVILAYNKVGWFRDMVDGAFRLIGGAAKWLWTGAIKPAFDGIMGAIGFVGRGYIGLWNNVVGPVIRAMVGGFLNLVSTIVHGAANAFGWVPGLGGKLKGAAAAIDRFKDDANGALARVTRRIDIGADVTRARQSISGLIREIGSRTAYVRVATLGPSGPTGGRQAFAKGGFPSDGEFTVGEEGPEIMRKRGSHLEVLSNRQSHRKLDAMASQLSAPRSGLTIGTLHVTIDGADIRQAGQLFDMIEEAAVAAGTGANREIL